MAQISKIPICVVVQKKTNFETWKRTLKGPFLVFRRIVYINFCMLFLINRILFQAIFIFSLKYTIICGY